MVLIDWLNVSLTLLIDVSVRFKWNAYKSSGKENNSRVFTLAENLFRTEDVFSCL